MCDEAMGFEAMKKCIFPDSFKKQRPLGSTVLDYPEEKITAALTLNDVRKSAKDWETFSSDAVGRVPIPEETKVRSVRQLPIELDPPAHAKYRNIIEPIFKRPLESDFQEKLTEQIAALVDSAIEMDSVEVVSQFALPLQSRALALLLNFPIEESEEWISWGVHIFKGDDTGSLEAKAAVEFDEYVEKQIDRVIKSPGKDIVSYLLSSEVDGRKLSREEVTGFVNLIFAGGRDTVINIVTNIIAYFSDNPESLEHLKDHSGLVSTATEEFVRYFSPLTHLGRVATKDVRLCNDHVKEGDRVSLCWASANRDENKFVDPDQIKLDRVPNPHVGFGFGNHSCIGATHARQIMRTLIPILAAKVKAIEINDFDEYLENVGKIKRKIGFTKLQAKFIPR